MKKNFFALIVIFFISFGFFDLPVVEAQSCSNVGYDSCGNYTSRSCSGATSCSVTDLGNGSCYQTCTCPVLTLQGSSFSGWTSGTFQNGQQFCTAMYEGPACQISGGSGASISFPAYACGTVNNNPSSVCNNNGICESGENSTYCPLDGCPPPTSSFFTLSVSPATRSVLNGELANFTLTITPSVSPTTGLGDVRAVGAYTLPVPIPGCPSGATCTYQGGSNTIQVTEDTTSGGVDFAVAASKGVIVAPSTVSPATYQLNFSAVNPFNQTKTATATLIVSSGINGATCLSIDSQVGGVSTSSFSPGQQFTLVARLRNTGTKIWDNVYTSASDQEHFLGAWNPGGDPWGPGSGRTRLPNGTAIPPNGEVTFTRTLTAPSTPGTYDFQFAIVEDAVQWITAPGAVCVKSGGVTVVASMPNLTAGTVTPTSTSINTATTFSSTISNSGSGSTGASFSNFFQVATAANGGGTVTDLSATTMSTLASGATGTATSPSYTFTTAGTYSVRACADKTNSSNTGSINETNESDNCGSWTTVTVGNGTNNASCTAITPSKTTVTPGEVFSASVTMYNNGTNTWSPNDMRADVSGVNNYHITVSPWASTWNWGRAAVSSNINPGSSTTFTIPLTAPSTAGTYNLSTQMLQEGVEWFGALCNAGTITVSNPNTCDPSAVGTNQMVGCVYTGMNFNSLAPISALTAPALSSPAPSSASPLPWTNWGGGGPGSLTDNYSVRWKGNFNFSAGNYTFSVDSDDGSRAYFDDNGDGNPDSGYLVSAWYDRGSGVVVSGSPVAVTAGVHRLVYEMYENGGGSVYNLSWTSTAPSPITVSISPYYTSITNYPTISDNSIYWTTTGNPDSCTTSGSSPWSTAIIVPIASGNQYQGNYPGTGTYTYNITCTKSGVSNATASITVPVSSTPLPSGTLTPASPSCTIASGASSCTVNLSWTTTNPIGTSVLTSNTSNTGASAPNTTVSSGNSGTNVAVTVPYSSRVFTLYNNSSLLATSNASASCVSGTTWNGSICAPNTPITVSISPYYTSITNYPTISDNSIYWTTTGNPDSCTTSGSSPWSTAVISPISGGMQYQGSYPGVGTYTYNITCMKAGVLNASASVSVAVSTAPPTQYTITVTRPVGGTVTTVDTFISCGATCTRQYTGGSTVTLQAVPSTSYWKFVGWGGACSGQGVGNCTITVSGNTAVTATFRPKALLYQEF